MEVYVQVTVTTVDKRKNKLVFKANFYEMAEKVMLVDFRLSTVCFLCSKYVLGNQVTFVSG